MLRRYTISVVTDFADVSDNESLRMVQTLARGLETPSTKIEAVKAWDYSDMTRDTLAAAYQEFCRAAGLPQVCATENMLRENLSAYERDFIAAFITLWDIAANKESANA